VWDRRLKVPSNLQGLYRIVSLPCAVIVLDIALGIVGAVIGGWLFRLFGMHGVTELNIYSLIVAVIGAVVFLVVYHAIRRRTV
jgi:uncharacterized membrane protein YeaQ/YmgE (transglycosylase-associated protein family)